MLPGPQPMIFQRVSIHMESSHMIKYNKTTIVNFQSVMVPQFCGRPTSKNWFFENSQSDHKHDPFVAI